MKRNKIISIIVIALLILATISGCQNKVAQQNTTTNQNGKSNNPIEIEFWGGWTGPDLDVMKSLVNKYNTEQNKVHVTFTSMQWTQLFAKFITEMKGGTPPDILAMHTFEIGQFAQMGVLDNENLKNVNVNGSDFADVAWKGVFYNGTQYAVPLDLDVHVLYYNKDLLEKAGIASPPSTGDELISDAQKLTIDKNGKHPNESGFDANNIVQYGLGMAMNHHIFYQAYALMNQQGYNPFTSTMTSVNLDDNKVANAFKFLQDLVFKYKVVPNGEKSQLDDFKTGKVAMIIDGPWQIPGLESSNINWDIAPYPKVFENQAVWGASEVLTFPKVKNPNNAKKEAAAEFVKWLLDNSGEFAKSGHVPVYNAGLEVAKSLKGRETIINSFKYAVLLPAHPKATQLFSASAPSPILTAANDDVLNDKNPVEIAKQLEKDFNNVLSQ